MASNGYWDPEKKAFVVVNIKPEARFQPNDIVVDAADRFWIVDTTMGVCGTTFEGSLCHLVYRPDTGVMDKFAAYQDTATLLELANEQGKYLCIAGSETFIDGNEDRCYDRLSSGTLHPESALRLLEKRSNYGREFTKNVYSMSSAAKEHFSKPDVQAWMRERVSERPDARFYLHGCSDVTIAQSAKEFTALSLRWANEEGTNEYWWEDAMSNGMAYADANGEPLRPPLNLIGLGSNDMDVELTAKQRQSNNCAYCGDALNETYDATVMHEGQRVHGSCAARLERLKAEAAPKVTKRDPYTGCQLGVERAYAVLMAERDAGFVSRFKADTVPAPKYREKFGAHPWGCDDDV